MNIFWTTFRKNVWQFHRGITLFALGFAMIGHYLWNFNDPIWRRLGNLELYLAFFMFGVGVFVLCLRYWTIRRAQQPKA